MPSLQTLRRPHPLRPGDTVAVIAPASPFDRASFETGLQAISGRYQVQYSEGIFERHRYLAGSDERRLTELTQALTDPQIRAVFCARGGYGTMRLLPKLAAIASALEPKPFIGFSDMTAIHLWLQREGLMSVHGPVLTQLGRVPEHTRQRLITLLESVSPPELLNAATTYVSGVAEGPLVGGNLSVFTRILGTPFMPELEGAVALLEDVSERPYRLDRMWTHLELAGVFRKVRGIALGTFNGCEDKDASYTSDQIVRELAEATGLPCAAGFPIGHGDINEPVLLGARVRLDADARSLTFLD